MTGAVSPASLACDAGQDCANLFDGALVRIDCERELTREPLANFRLGVLLPTQECMTTFYPR